MNLTTLTLGCKVNQYETEYLATALARLGYVATPPGETADLVIVNTCTVTAESEAKSRKAVRRLAARHPGAEIVVMGCYATRDPLGAEALPNVSGVLTDKAMLPDFLRRRGLADPPRGLDRFGRRHRAYIKVQDGCTSRCAYCIIPTVRPVMSSRPVGDVREEVRTLIDVGYREIVLTGIHLGFYRDENGARLHDLVAALVEPESPAEATAADFRLRISSLEAMEVTDELLDLMDRYPRRICRHLHLSLQSGSDAVLRAMRRPHPSGVFLRRCEEIRNRLPNIALTTDVFVGFPGETDADFRRTLDVVEQIAFSKVHVFRFSPREGTDAAALSEVVPENVKRDRAAELTALSERLRRDYAAAQIDRSVQVLVENRRIQEQTATTNLSGTAEIYLPVKVSCAEDADNPVPDCGDLVVATVSDCIRMRGIEDSGTDDWGLLAVLARR